MGVLRSDELLGLRPSWLDGSDSDWRNHSRYGLGFSFDCPRHILHPWPCRLEMYYQSPDDGYPADNRALTLGLPLYGHHGHPFDGITLWQEYPKRSSQIAIPGHWRGIIKGGVVWTIV